MTNLFYLRVLAGGAAYGVLTVVLLVGGYSGIERQARWSPGSCFVVLALESFQVIPRGAAPHGVGLDRRRGPGRRAGGRHGRGRRRRGGVVAFLWVFVASNVANFAIVATVALRQSGRLHWRPRPASGGRWRAAVLLGLAQLCITLYYRRPADPPAVKPAEGRGPVRRGHRVLETFVVVPSLAMTVLTPVVAAASLRAGRAPASVRPPPAPDRDPCRFRWRWRASSPPRGSSPAVPGFGEFSGAGAR